VSNLKHRRVHAAALEQPTTEQPNPRTSRLSTLSTRAMVLAMQREDAAVAPAVRKAAPAIAGALERMVPLFEAGGRLIYIGAGTSGRLGVLDAAECPPTFGLPASRVVGVIAGGERALRRSVEGAEDRPAAARADLKKLRLTPLDVVVGIAASGRTPYTIAGVEYAREQGCMTVAVACTPGSPLAAAANLAIEPITGPEAVAGSTRMKAGSAQKMVLNLLSTGLMVRMGRVEGNRMVHVRASNAKLRERALRMVAETLGDRARARRLLRRAGGNVARALEMARDEAAL